MTDYNSTEALDELLTDKRFEGDVKPRLSDHNEARLTLFANHVAEMESIITDEFGLELVEKSRGSASGDWIATVIDPDGEEPEAPDVDVDRSVSSMF
jgi:hypothetical protein